MGLALTEINLRIHPLERRHAIRRQRGEVRAGERLVHLEVLARESARHGTLVIDDAHRLHYHVGQRRVIECDHLAGKPRGVAQHQIEVRLAGGVEQVRPPRAKFEGRGAQGDRLVRRVESHAVTAFDVRADGLGEVGALLDFHGRQVQRLARLIGQRAGEDGGQVEFGQGGWHVGHCGRGTVAQFAVERVGRGVLGISPVEVPQARQPGLAPGESCEHVRANLLLGARRDPHAHLVHLAVEILVAAPVGTTEVVVLVVADGAEASGVGVAADEQAVQVEPHALPARHGGDMHPLVRAQRAHVNVAVVARARLNAKAEGGIVR